MSFKREGDDKSQLNLLKVWINLQHFMLALITETSAKSTHAASVSIFKLTTYCSYFFGE